MDSGEVDAQVNIVVVAQVDEEAAAAAAEVAGEGAVESRRGRNEWKWLNKANDTAFFFRLYLDARSEIAMCAWV
jgi:hypothetical protein